MNSLIAGFLVGFKHVKTTIGGIAAIAGGVGLLAPELAKLANGEPINLVAVKTAWVAICGGVALIFAKDADKSNAPSPVATPVATPRGFSSFWLVFVLLVCSVFGVALAPRFARASDPAAPALGVCFDKASVICLRPIASFGGSAYDFSQQQIVRSVTVSGLYELTLLAYEDGKPKLGIAAGGGFQTGTVQGAVLTQLVTLPYSLAVGVTELVVGSRASVTALVGTVTRF